MKEAFISYIWFNKLFFFFIGNIGVPFGHNIFDIIEVNRNLASPDAKGLRIKPVDAKGHYGKVFKPAFLTQQSGRYKGTPFRTFSNGQFIKGYSDHYPTYIIIGK